MLGRKYITTAGLLFFNEILKNSSGTGFKNICSQRRICLETTNQDLKSESEVSCEPLFEATGFQTIDQSELRSLFYLEVAAPKASRQL